MTMKVFHFLKAEYALKAISEQRLKLSLFDDLNDPFELFSANVSDPKIREALTKFKQENMAAYGLHCFSQKFSNPLLWSHYGDRHCGVALEFEIHDEDVLEVRYEPNRLLVDWQQHAARGGFGSSDLEAFLVTKFEHWKYEDEVRTFCKLDTAKKEGNFYFDAFSDSLKLVRVLLGATCAITNNEISTALPTGQKLSVMNTMLSFQSYAIEIDGSKPERIIESKLLD